MIEADAPAELELRDYLRVANRRKWVIVLAAAAVVAAALVTSFLQTPVYAAEAEVLLQRRNSETLFDPDTGARNDPERVAETEIRIIESEPVRRAVEEELGSAPEVSASTLGDTDVIGIRARDTEPEHAATVANAYARAYIDFRRQQAVDDLLAAGQEIQEKIDELDAEVRALDREIADAGRSAPDDSDEEATAPQTLVEQRDGLVRQQALFEQQLDQVQLGASLKTGGAQLVTPADIPTSPVEPQPVRNGILGAVVGLVLGIGLAFLFEYLDDSIRDDEELRRASGAPTVGMIPAVSAWKKPDEARIVSLTDPGAGAAEAYRTLRTSLQFLALDRPMRTIQVTSPIKAEGKSTTLANLAVALARADQKVVVVDCDLRHPRVHAFFGVANDVGFTSVLIGDVPLSGALQPGPIEGLAILASGPLPPMPSELLSSPRTGEVFTALHAEYDWILIDSPPVLPVSDTTVLASWVDALLLVGTAHMTSRRHLRRAVNTLAQVDAPIVGTVLNQAGAEVSYGYAYLYNLAPPDGDGRRRKRFRRRKDRGDGDDTPEAGDAVEAEAAATNDPGGEPGLT